jgi:hypothetical protein
VVDRPSGLTDPFSVADVVETDVAAEVVTVGALPVVKDWIGARASATPVNGSILAIVQ